MSAPALAVATPASPKTKTHRPMTLHASPPGSPSLGALLAQVEAAWTHNRDADLPTRLAEMHPEYADDLIDFFDDLVLGSLNPSVPEEDRDEASRSLVGELRSTGKSALADAIERSRSLGNGHHDGGDPNAGPAGGRSPLRLVSVASAEAPTSEPVPHQEDAVPSVAVVHETYYEYVGAHDHGLPQIADAFGLPVATTHTLVINSDRCPVRAQREMARRGADYLSGVEYPMGLAVLKGSGKTSGYALPKAASRSSAYGPRSGFSYVETIRSAPSSFLEKDRAFWLSLAGDDEASR